MATGSMSDGRRPSRAGREAIARVVEAYDDRVIRTYSRARFLILRQRFLDEIGQYLPLSGDVLDLGCGFGLFSLYYAQVLPGCELPRRRRGRPARRHRPGGGAAARARERRVRRGRRAGLPGQPAVRGRLHAGHRPPRRARGRAAPAGRAPCRAGARRVPPREGRGHAAGLQALVHARARPPGQPGQPAALLGGRDPAGGARGGGVPGRSGTRWSTSFRIRTCCTSAGSRAPEARRTRSVRARRIEERGRRERLREDGHRHVGSGQDQDHAPPAKIGPVPPRRRPAPRRRRARRGRGHARRARGAPGAGRRRGWRRRRRPRSRALPARGGRGPGTRARRRRCRSRRSTARRA